ncbi:(2Fe-2S)-binding protein [Jiella sonneratiae]|uniref:(2Fe-2S)-binding protein n=1 Tax=Jiella sonneratiae TaxID=2816856 RepID=A0ABS3J5A5_9HYPH|nr:(2Fe-2S)-binding protein [Jiella sonneratiae]MBO0904133.1 (2Fe-2S)-binding protein [Jiella sonneratiae]
MKGRMVRLAGGDRPAVGFRLDGRSLEARAGDTVLTAVLTQVGSLRLSEFGDGPRAGFCLMAACQDCWMWTEDGGRLRACDTPVSEGMALRTTPPGDETWPTRAS